MPGVITKYHRHFIPKPGKNAFFKKEMTDIRNRRAAQIKTLRKQYGRKAARAEVILAYREHAKKHNAAVKTRNETAGLRAARQTNTARERRKALASAGFSRSPKVRKRGGGNIYRKTVTGIHGKPRRYSIITRGNKP